MRITSKGQVTIPVAIREAAGLMPNTDVEFVLEGASVRIVKAETGRKRPSRGEEALRRLRGSGTANMHMTTDEIIQMMRGDPP